MSVRTLRARSSSRSAHPLLVYPTELTFQPSLAKEIALYQMVNTAPRTSKLAKLKPFIPQFYGTLRLEGRMDDSGSLQQDVDADVPEVRSSSNSRVGQRGGTEESECRAGESGSRVHSS